MGLRANRNLTELVLYDRGSGKTSFPARIVLNSANGPCAQTVYTLALMKSLYRYFRANVYTTWVQGPLGFASLVWGSPKSVGPANPRQGRYFHQGP